MRECVKIIRIRENTDQKNSEYGLFTQCYRQSISLSHYPLTSRVKLMCVTFLANIHILYPLKTPEKQRLPEKGYHCISSSSNRHNESPQIKLNLFMANIHI